jgi:indolepyruvate decarboxylase
MSQTVIQYVLSRLKQLGVSDVFGVPGDFVYPVCDAIIDDSEIKWIGCANELNASYAADGYARTRGIGVVVSTYGAGETCTWGGLAGANAENSKVVSLVGMPGISEWKTETRSHHMISDQPPEYDLFAKMISPFTAGGNCSVVITPENCVYETERLIAALLYFSRPINMAFPRDIVNKPVILPEEKAEIPLANLKRDNDALNAGARELVHRLSIAKQACILPSYLLRRYNCVEEARAFIEKSGLPFFVTLQDKSILPESHPQFGGVYLGQWTELADPKVSNYVNGCDCIIGLGPEKHDLNTGFYSMKHDFKSSINIMAHKTRIGMTTYDKVGMKDVLTQLIKKLPEGENSAKVTYSGFFDQPSGDQSDKISYNPLFERVQEFLKPNDILVADASISSICGSAKMKLPDGVDLEAQTSWGCYWMGNSGYSWPLCCCP